MCLGLMGIREGLSRQLPMTYLIAGAVIRGGKKKHTVHAAHMYSRWTPSNNEHAVLAYAVQGLRVFGVFGNSERRDQFSKEKISISWGL